MRAEGVATPITPRTSKTRSRVGPTLIGANTYAGVARTSEVLRYFSTVSLRRVPFLDALTEAVPEAHRRDR
jgi:hypothetical protein